ncbi:unnamed protein product [Boreogadus saida]
MALSRKTSTREFGLPMRQCATTVRAPHVFSDVSGISTTRLVVAVISAMVEKELGEITFDSLKYMNLDMEEKGIVARHEAPPSRGTTTASTTASLPAAEAVVPRQRAEGLRQETIAVNNRGQQSLSPP